MFHVCWVVLSSTVDIISFTFLTHAAVYVIFDRFSQSDQSLPLLISLTCFMLLLPLCPLFLRFLLTSQSLSLHVPLSSLYLFLLSLPLLLSLFFAFTFFSQPHSHRHRHRHRTNILKPEKCKHMKPKPCDAQILNLSEHFASNTWKELSLFESHWIFRKWQKGDLIHLNLKLLL